MLGKPIGGPSLTKNSGSCLDMATWRAFILSSTIEPPVYQKVRLLPVNWGGGGGGWGCLYAYLQPLINI